MIGIVMPPISEMVLVNQLGSDTCQTETATPSRTAYINGNRNMPYTDARLPPEEGFDASAVE